MLSVTGRETGTPEKSSQPVNAGTRSHAQRWISQTPAETPIAEVWEGWTRELWREGRREFMSELGAITDEQVAGWAQGLKTSLSSQQKRMLERIRSYADDRGLDVIGLIAEARASEIVASALQKNPTKRNPFEPLAAAAINERTGHLTVQLASKRANLQIRFSRTGGVTVGGTASADHSKSADLLTLIERADGSVQAILSAHKFARVAGGHQDNQRRDAIDFLDQALLAREAGVEIPGLRELASELLDREISAESFEWEPALILDGEYFTSNPVKRGAMGSSAFIGTTDGFISRFSSAEKRASAMAAHPQRERGDLPPSLERNQHPVIALSQALGAR